jgi:hypothetical protein
MKHKISRELFEYWNRRRKDKKVPDRSDIEPYDFGRKLVETFLLEIDRTGEAHFRFCGSSLANRYGRDMTGESFLLAWPMEDRTQMQNHFVMMMQTGHGFVAGMAAETAGGGVINYEITVLPLRGEREINQAIGSLVRIGGHDETNRVRDRIVGQTLRSVRVLEDQDRAFLEPRDITHRLPPVPRPSHIRKHYGHLAVISGEK